MLTLITRMPNQTKHGARLVGRWMKPNGDDTIEAFAIWEYDSYEDYQAIEEKIRSDEAHLRRTQDWYARHGGREGLRRYVLEVRDDPLESTLDR